MLAPGTGLRSLFSDSILYGVARAVATVCGVLLVPVYTRLLPVADYGVIENLNILIVVGSSLFGLSLSQALYKYYATSAVPRERREVFTTLTILSVGAAAVGVLAGLLLRHPLSLAVFKQKGSDVWVPLALALGLVALQIQGGLFLPALTINSRRASVVITSLGTVLTTVMLSILFVAVLRLRVLGVFLAGFIANLLFTLYAAFACRDDIRLRSFRPSLAPQFVRYSIAFIPASLSVFVIRSSDRYFLTALFTEGLDLVGLYSMAEKLMTPLSLIGAAFAVAFMPFAMKASKQADARALYLDTFRYFVVVTAAFSIVCTALSPVFLRVLATPPYYPSSQFTPLLGIYLSLNALVYLASLGLVLAGRVELLVPAVVVASVVNLAGNALLIPTMRVQGAALSTVIACAVYNALVFRLSEKHYPVGYPLAGAAILYGTACAAAFGFVANLWIGLLVSGVFVGLTAHLGFFGKSDLQRASRLLTAPLGR